MPRAADKDDIDDRDDDDDDDDDDDETPRGPSFSVLRIHGDLGRLAEVGWLLFSVNQAYNALYVLEEYNSFPPQFLIEQGGAIIEALPRRQPLGHLVPSEARAVLRGAQFSSPGFWDIAGIGKMADTLRQYLNDRHERRKDARWREAGEREKLELEIEERKVDILTKKVELFRIAGMPDHLIRAYIVAPVTRPLDALDRAKRRNLITGAEIIEPDRDEPPPATQT